MLNRPISSLVYRVHTKWKLFLYSTLVYLYILYRLSTSFSRPHNIMSHNIFFISRKLCIDPKWFWMNEKWLINIFQCFLVVRFVVEAVAIQNYAKKKWNDEHWSLGLNFWKIQCFHKTSVLYRECVSCAPYLNLFASWWNSEKSVGATPYNLLTLATIVLERHLERIWSIRHQRYRKLHCKSSSPHESLAIFIGIWFA